MRWIVSLIILVGLGVGAFFLLRPTTNTNSTTDAVNTSITNIPTPVNDQLQLAQLASAPLATVKTSLGTFTIQFYPQAAPELTKNFIELAKTGYYNGLIFHRVIAGFVIQGGDPKGDGTGGHSYQGDNTSLDDEAGALRLRHLKGAVAWAKAGPKSIGSQFYVALKPLTQLDGGYSVFGQVVQGMEVIDAIGAVQTGPDDKPIQPVTIESVTVTD